MNENLSHSLDSILINQPTKFLNKNNMLVHNE